MTSSDERKSKRRERDDARRRANREKRISSCTLEEVADINNLYYSAMDAACGVRWKLGTFRYMHNALSHVIKAHDDLLAGNDIRMNWTSFRINERGIPRNIDAPKYPERVIQKSLVHHALIPAYVPTLTQQNCANIKGRGTSEAIRIMARDLREMYRVCGGPNFWIGFYDGRGYFDNLEHMVAIEIVHKMLDDLAVIRLTEDQIRHQGNPLTSKGLSLGNEVSQILAVAQPSHIDHFIQEVCGVAASQRYMDDGVIMHKDKESVHIIMSVIRDHYARIGIEFNEKKTRVVKASRGFVYLQKKFFFTGSGKLVITLTRESVARERRRMKKNHAKVRSGEMTFDQARQVWQSRRGDMLHYNAYNSVKSLDKLFAELYQDYIDEYNSQRTESRCSPVCTAMKDPPPKLKLDKQ